MRDLPRGTFEQKWSGFSISLDFSLPSTQNVSKRPMWTLFFGGPAARMRSRGPIAKTRFSRKFSTCCSWITAQFPPFSRLSRRSAVETTWERPSKRCPTSLISFLLGLNALLKFPSTEQTTARMFVLLRFSPKFFFGNCLSSSAEPLVTLKAKHSPRLLSVIRFLAGESTSWMFTSL